MDRALQNSGRTTKSDIDDQDDIEELGVKKLSCSQSLVHSAYDSAESIATPPDSDLDDEQLRKMPASPLCIWEREENAGQARPYHSERLSLMVQSYRNPEVSGKPDAECVHKREANAQRTQAYHSRRDSLTVSSSRESSKFQGNLMRCFRATVNRVRTRFPKETEVTNRETDSRVVFILFSNLMTWQMLGNLFWWKQDHSLNQARCKLVKQEQVDLLTVVSMNFSNKLVLKDWNWRTPITVQ